MPRKHNTQKARHAARASKRNGPSSRVKRTMKGGWGSKPVELDKIATQKITNLQKELSSLQKVKSDASGLFRNTVATATHMVVPTWTNTSGVKRTHSPEYRDPSALKSYLVRKLPMPLARRFSAGNQATVTTSEVLKDYNTAKKEIRSVKDQIAQIQKTGKVIPNTMQNA